MEIKTLVTLQDNLRSTRQTHLYLEMTKERKRRKMTVMKTMMIAIAILTRIHQVVKTMMTPKKKLNRRRKRPKKKSHLQQKPKKMKMIVMRVLILVLILQTLRIVNLAVTILTVPMIMLFKILKPTLLKEKLFQRSMLS